MRICLVSPYAWDRPHLANDHCGALARVLAAAGHELVILAPARGSALLREGRHRLRLLERGDATALTPIAGKPLVVAVGLALPVRTGRPAGGVAAPVGVRAGVRVALEHGRFDVVDCIDADVPGASAAALTESPAPTVASFVRIGPLLRSSRSADRLAGRADAVLAVDEEAADTVRRRFGLHAIVSGWAVDAQRFPPGAPVAPPLVAVEAATVDRSALKSLFAELAPSDAEIALLRVGNLSALRPLVPAAMQGRVRTIDAATPGARATVLSSASVLVAATSGSALLVREAVSAGVPVVIPAGSRGLGNLRHEVSALVVPDDEPALVSASVGRILDSPALAARLAAEARAALSADVDAAVAEVVLATYAGLGGPRRPAVPAAESDERILCDFHMHTDFSGDCATRVEDLVERALELGLGAIAVTDHNTIQGGLAARRYVEERGLPLHVIVGSEIKTASGEVIGLYLEEEVRRGMPFADTVEAIHAQGALVYVPHPFDRMHSIADPALLRRLVDQLDILETYNARLYREAFNREAAAFAARHDLTAAAGSDAHVLEGLGTGAVELPRFDGPESLLFALGAGRIVKRPRNLAYLQGLKWIRQTRKPKAAGESS